MKKKILIVDDEVDLVDIIAEELDVLGYETLRAHDGQAALDIIRTSSPDLVISDINMPKMDGLKMLEAIKLEKINIPVILCTGYSDKEKIHKAWKLGAFDFLDKPVPFETLKSLVRNALEFGKIISVNEANQSEITITLSKDIYSKLIVLSKQKNITPLKFIEDLIQNA